MYYPTHWKETIRIQLQKKNRKSFEFNPIYSTATKKPEYLFYCHVFDGAKDSVSHVRVMKNPSINQLKWNWVDPQAVRPNAASAKLNPWPKSLCVHYLLRQQPLFLGEGRRNSCPLMTHSRVTVWKVHFDLCCWRFRIAPPPPPQQSCLWLFDLSKDLWTLSVSVNVWPFGSSDIEQQRDLQLNPSVRFLPVQNKRWVLLA